MRVNVDFSDNGATRPPANEVLQVGPPDRSGVLSLAGIIQKLVPGNRVESVWRAEALIDEARDSMIGSAMIRFPAKRSRAGGTIAVILTESDRHIQLPPVAPETRRSGRRQ
jgi:hypothetical protein